MSNIAPDPWAQARQALTTAGTTLQPGEQIIGAVTRNGQQVYATNLGNVYAPQGGFLGSYNSASMAGARNDPGRTFSNFEDTGHGYRLVTPQGNGYDFNDDGGQLDKPDTSLGVGSPEYDALQRALDQEGSNDAANAAGDQADLLSQRAFYEPEARRLGGIARRGISQDAESRGVYGGGSMERALAEQRAAEQTQVNQLGLNEATGVGKIQRTLAQQQADIARRKAEGALSAAGQRDLKTGLQPYQTPAV